MTDQEKQELRDKLSEAKVVTIEILREIWEGNGRNWVVAGVLLGVSVALAKFELNILSNLVLGASIYYFLHATAVVAGLTAATQLVKKMCAKIDAMEREKAIAPAPQLVKRDRPTFYVTFGQKSPFRNGWVEIVADDIEAARRETARAFGDGGWSMIYGNGTNDRKFDPSFFPAGRIGELIVLPPGYVH